MVKKFVLWTLVIGCMALIFHFSSQPSDDSMDLSDGLLDKILAFFNISLPENVVMFMRIFIRKVAHFAVYSLLGFLVYLLFKVGYEAKVKAALCGAVLIGSLYSITDEVHQLFVDGRSGSVKDVMLDSTGALFGIIIAWGICCILSRRKKNG